MAFVGEALFVLFLALLQVQASPLLGSNEGLPKQLLLGSVDSSSTALAAAVRLTNFDAVRSSLDSGHVVNFEADLRQCAPVGLPLERIGGKVDNFVYDNPSEGPNFIRATVQRQVRIPGNVEHRHVQISIREDDLVELQLTYWSAQNGTIRETYEVGCRIDNGLNGGHIGFFAIGSSSRNLPNFTSIRDALRAGRKVTSVIHYAGCLINGTQDASLFTYMGNHVVDYDVVNANRIDFTTTDAHRKTTQALMGDMIYNVRTHEVYSNGTVFQRVSSNDYKFEQEEAVEVYQCAIHSQEPDETVYFYEID